MFGWGISLILLAIFFLIVPVFGYTILDLEPYSSDHLMAFAFFLGAGILLLVINRIKEEKEDSLNIGFQGSGDSLKKEEKKVDVLSRLYGIDSKVSELYKNQIRLGVCFSRFAIQVSIADGSID